MNRRTFLSTLAGGLLAAPLAAETQPGGKVYRIGYMSPGIGPSSLTEAFRQGLRDLGYIEGQNLLIEFRWTGRGDQLSEQAGELVGIKPNVIVTVSHRTSLAVKKATATIPVVFAHVNDAVGVGLVTSLAHPGGNVTGLSAQGLDLIGKRLELLKELIPGEARLAYLHNPEEPYSSAYLREVQRAALVLGMKEVLSVEARTHDACPAGFRRHRWPRLIRTADARPLPTSRGVRGQDSQGPSLLQRADQVIE